MRPKSFITPPSAPRCTFSRRFGRQSIAGLVLWLGFLTPAVQASPPKDCRAALPLPLDRSIESHAGDRPIRYAVDVTTSGFLLIETGSLGWRSSPEVRFLGSSCEVQTGNLPLPSVRGRHIQRIESPGTYFFEVAGDRPGTSFRINAWMVREQQSNPSKREPMDEADDLRGGGKREPMDEADDLRSGGATTAWQEISGYGLVELRQTAASAHVLLHPWCPRSERPGLLHTFTCARSVDIPSSGSLAILPWLGGEPELLRIRLDSTGWLAFETEGGRADAALLDAQGELETELKPTEPVWLEAGSYFLQLGASAGTGAVILATELD